MFTAAIELCGCGLPCCLPTLPRRWRKAAVKPGQQPERVKKPPSPVNYVSQIRRAVDTCRRNDLRKGDVVLVEAGDIIL